MTAQQFWHWFEQHNEKYLFFGDLPEADFEVAERDLSRQLEAYCAGLSFQIPINCEGLQQLVITACYEEALFPQVEALVQAAPVLPRWEVIAFVQPTHFTLCVSRNGLTLDPDQIWYFPGHYDFETRRLDLFLYVRNIDWDRLDEYGALVSNLLAEGLGEKDYATFLNEITLREAPFDTEDGDHWPLCTLGLFLPDMHDGYSA